MVLGKVFSFVDDGIMYGVNKAVYCWNWTTGRPKEDLANLLWVTGNYFIINGISGASSTSPRAKYFTYSFFGFSAFSGYGLNNFIAEAEQKSPREKNFADFEAERSKSNYRFLGPIFIGCSITLTFEEPNQNLELTSLGEASTGLGMAMMGASTYVMRADPLKPRKDFVSRFIESLYQEPATVDAE